MSVFITLILFLLILGVLVFAHEMGHFVAARMGKIKVEEFGFGFPPRIFGVKRGETIYSLNWVPLGGFCKMLGEEDPSKEGSFASKKAWVRLGVLFAGPFMNAVLPIVLLTVAFMVPRQVVVGDVLIDEVAADSPAAVAGIETGDIILSINDHEIQNIGDVIYDIHLNMGEELTFVLKKADDSIKAVTVIPRWNPPEGEGAVGIALAIENTSEVSRSYAFWEAVPKSISSIGETFVLMRNEIRSWFVQKKAPQVTGPVGIFQLTGEVSEAGPSYLIQFAAFLSINLAIVNLLPLPALDGGRIVFILIEVARRGKRVSPRTEGLIHMVGFAMLIGLILVISYFDILRAIRGESLTP
ncbi:MAG: PDZ domain-containing protein [Chloroflexi bacterium]|nr:PDZ domain-containing protein [Chloroflexota bacterium]